MNQKIYYSEYVDEAFKSPEGETYFYGYYNTPQVNSEGDKVLAQKVDFEGRMPELDDVAEVGFFDKQSKKWTAIGLSRAFNWQQGCHAQWLGPDYSTRILYNDREANSYLTRIFSLETGENQVFEFPSYAIHPSGTYSISIDYSRAYCTRAYSYAGIKDIDLDKDITPKDGLFRVDFVKGETIQIFSLSDWLLKNEIQLQQGIRHWIEHPMFSPDGNFIFAYYRFGEMDSFETVGLILNPETGEVVHRINLDARESLSHIGWNEKNEIAIYISPRKVISDRLVNPQTGGFAFRLALSVYRRFFKVLVPRKMVNQITSINSFYRIYRFTDQKHRDIKLKELAIDGHPSFTKNSEFMLTDTYQDNENYRNLYLVHLASEKVYLLGRFYSYVNNMGWRADLHPRFSLDEKFVLIDTNTSGFHQLIMLKIDWEKIPEKQI